MFGHFFASDSTAAAAEGRVPKLNHRKSRFGCQRCRARRVKCSEEMPTCQNCLRHKLSCVYDRKKGRATSCRGAADAPADVKAHHYHQRVSIDVACEATRPISASCLAPYAGCNLPETAERRVLETRLMYQWMAQTACASAIDELTLPCFSTSLTWLALTFDALRFMAYSVAALHLTYLGSDARSGLAEALGDSLENVHHQYLLLSLQEAQQTLVQITPDNIDGVSLLGGLIRLYTFATLKDRDLEPYSPPMDWLRVNKTSKSIFTVASIMDPPNGGDSVAWHFLGIGLELFDPHRVSSAIPTYDHLLEGLDKENRDADILAAYEDAVQSLNAAQVDLHTYTRSQNDFLRRLVLFPVFVHDTFVELIDERDPRALVILAHYFALLANASDFWWIGQSGKREVRAIAGALNGTTWKDMLHTCLAAVDLS